MYFTKKREISFLAIVIIIILTSVFISFCSKDSKNPVKNDDVENTFTKAYDSTKVIVSSTGLQVVGNQIIIRFKENVDIETAESIINNAGGELVGQIPALGIFQAEFDFATSEELDAKITELSNHSDVELATYNSLHESRKTNVVKEYCKQDYDNHELEQDQINALQEIDYYAAIPLMGFVKEKMTLSEVKIAVFDDAIRSSTTKEFDNVSIDQFTDFNTSGTNGTHGTMVAGVIAADNKDGGVNGIASSLIGDKLKIYSYDNAVASVIQDIEMIFLACSVDKVNVINMSYGYGGYFKNSSVLKTCTKNRSLYQWTFENFPDVLFVCAAANEYFEISTTNDAPAGIQLSNVITVSGTKYKDPTLACDWCSYGSLIDIAGPNEKIALVDPSTSNKIKLDDGNSFTTPMVVALAGVLKSIDSDLTPSKIKNYILENSLSTATSVSGRRLNICLPIEQLLIDMDAPEEVLDKVDLYEPEKEADAPGVVECRICAFSTVTVSGEDLMRVDTDSTNMAILTHEGGTLVFVTENQMFTLGLMGYEFLTTDFPIINAENEMSTNTAVATYLNTSTMVVGNSLNGTLTINSAYVTELNPLTNAPMMIQIEGEFSGTMEMTDGENIRTVAFGGKLVMPMILFSDNADFLDYFEVNCEY